MTENYDRVIIAALLDPDPEKYNMEDSMKLILMSADLRFRDDYFMKDIVIVDLNDVSIQHIAKYTLPVFKKLETCAFVSIFHPLFNHYLHLRNVLPLQLQKGKLWPSH